MEYSTNLNILNKMSENQLKKCLSEKDTGDLVIMKNYLDDIYYNRFDETSPLDDFRYDILKDILTERDSTVSNIVGSKIRDDDNRVKLPYYLGSIDKIKFKEDAKLNNWIRKNNCDNYIFQSKLDGCSCLLVLQEGILKIYTRGDGILGADISHLLKYINGIPYKNLKGNIAVRGELIIKKAVFRDKYSCESSNPRNMVSGLLNAKTFREGVNDINFVAYEMIDDEAEYQPKLSVQFDILSKIGFEIVKHKSDTDLSMENLSESLIFQKQYSDYEIDGIVICSDVEYIRNVEKNPKYAFAFKMQLDGNLIEAEVVDVIWKISKFKLLKPRVQVKPVVLNGVTIQFATGFNARYILEQSIGKGTIIKLTRSGDVIPYIIQVVKCSTHPEMPTTKYAWNQNNVDIISLEGDDEANIKLISAFFKGLDIKNLNDRTVEKLYNSGYTTLEKILSAGVKDIEQIDGFQKKLAEKVYNHMHDGLKNVYIHDVLGSSGVFEGFGSRKIAALLEAIPDLFIIYEKISSVELENRICEVDGFSKKSAYKIIDNISNAASFLKTIDKFVTYKGASKDGGNNSLVGSTFLFSGFRDKAMEEFILERGGKVVTSISSNLNFLIVSDEKSTSSKITKARSLGVKIISKENFFKIFG